MIVGERRFVPHESGPKTEKEKEPKMERLEQGIWTVKVSEAERTVCTLNQVNDLLYHISLKIDVRLRGEGGIQSYLTTISFRNPPAKYL